MKRGQETLSSSALEAELERIGDWWLEVAVDQENGGFYGEIGNNGRPVVGARKSIILTTRILWFFAEAYRFSGQEKWLIGADRAYGYLLDHFVDTEHGGFFWEVDSRGEVLDDRKQTYAHAFGIYAFCAYASASNSDEALKFASDLFELVEARCKEPVHGGYLESFGRNWSASADMRLSEVDEIAPKSMNCHLHILEAYTALFSVSKAAPAGAALRELLQIFATRIVRPNRTMRLFFESDWSEVGDAISCGHDIEASWLLVEAATALGDKKVLSETKRLAKSMADRCLEFGVRRPGYILNEINEDRTFDLSSPWWVQAEGLVGFLWMYAEHGDQIYLEAAHELWSFIQDQHFDLEHGEWLWGARKDCPSQHRNYKAGSWKGPYHNGRAMMESIRILRKLEAAKATGRESRCAANNDEHQL